LAARRNRYAITHSLTYGHTSSFGPSLALPFPDADEDGPAKRIEETFWEDISIVRRGREVKRVKYNENRVDEMVLALMHLTTFNEASGYRTWKGHDWEVLNRLHQNGFIGNPKSKVRSVDLTAEGKHRSEDLFKKHFS
jgi:hypothetical protein